MKRKNLSFNLVIEKLLIPTIKPHTASFALSTFQSRNRETFDSNLNVISVRHNEFIKFQSRNRETFDSNAENVTSHGSAGESFNLVIEKLLIPTTFHACIGNSIRLFQSRNRETFDSNARIFTAIYVSIS